LKFTKRYIDIKKQFIEGVFVDFETGVVVWRRVKLPAGKESLNTVCSLLSLQKAPSDPLAL
jgi:hypothetical protein